MKTKISIILLALMAVAFLAVAPAAADLTLVPAGGVVFVGEEGLILTDPATAAPLVAAANLEWFTPGSAPGSSPAAYYSAGVGNNLIDKSFLTRTGNWYMPGIGPAGLPVMNVQVPSIDVKAYNAETGKDMTDGRIVKGSKVAFRIDSNLHTVVNQRAVLPLPAPPQYTNIKVVVVDSEGTKYTALVDDITGLVSSTSSLTGITGVLAGYEGLAPATAQSLLPASAASVATAALAGAPAIPANWDLDSTQYKAGVYTFYAEVDLNNAKGNVGTLTGVTQSPMRTLDVGKDDIKVTSNKDNVVRNNDFAITITGQPSLDYVLWVKGTSSIGGPGVLENVPFIKANQIGVAGLLDPKYPLAGAYRFTGAAGLSPNPAGDACLGVAPNGGQYYAMVTLSDSGTRTVGFSTDMNTKDQTYTIRADQYVNPVGTFSPKYDTIKVKVEKGGITVAASGDSSYFIGEEVVFSGTNSDSSDVFLFITGPNLPNNGGDLLIPANEVLTGGNIQPPLPAAVIVGGWIPVSVETDDTWEFKWNTANVNLDAGTYTVYAVTSSTGKGQLGVAQAIYETTSVVIKKPFITATASSLTVARGDDLYLRGNAEGDPIGIAIWVLGKNYVIRTTETVEDDGSFEHKFSADTLASGQYFVVLQHPMENGVFDVAIGGTGGNWVVNTQTAPITEIFQILGNDARQGSEAATALVNAMNDMNVDDTYYKLTFMVEEPWIVIDAIGDRHVGDTFTITGTTNLAVGDKLIVEATSASFKLTDKTQGAGFVGSTGTVIVAAGDEDGKNVWEYAVDASAFIPDQYIVTVEAIEASLTGTQTFNVMAAQPTTKPTEPVETPVAPVTPVKTAEPTPEQTAPGFGVLVALIGLGAVAALIVRRD